MTDIGKLASQLTNYPALALTAPTPATVSRFDIIYVDANTFIIVVLLSNNTVKNKLVHLPVSVTQSMEQEISYAQAVLGADIEVPTLDGSVKLNIPEGTQAGSVFRMDKGLCLEEFLDLYKK